MQSRFLKTLLLAAVIVGGIWILVNRDRIRQPEDVLILLNETFSSQDVSARQPEFNPANPVNSGAANPGAFLPSGFSKSGPGFSSSPARQVATNVIRVASFKLNPKISTTQGNVSLDLVADICRRYDLIAFQEVDSQDNNWLARLTDRMNQMGSAGTIGNTANPNGTLSNKRSDYFFMSDRDHNPGRPTQSAIVFNRQTLELDQSKWYSVNDPDNLLQRKPIVAWFRARGPRPEQSLTFTFANVKIDAARPEEELLYLGQLFRAIRNDGRGEDDVLIVGDFNAGEPGLQPIRKMDGLTWVVSKPSTHSKGPALFDNLVFNETATVEFTGRGGVFDFMRHYNLRLDDASRISDHMPVWAEFSIFEGLSAKSPTVLGTPGRVAARESTD